jgi:replicative DNA helicase
MSVAVGCFVADDRRYKLSPATYADFAAYFERPRLRFETGLGRRVPELGAGGLGLPHDGVTVIAGYPGDGKTTLLLNLARLAVEMTEGDGALVGRSVHFFSYEEPWQALAMKLLMIKAGKVLDTAANQVAYERAVRSGSAVEEAVEEAVVEAQRWLSAALDSRRLQLHDSAVNVRQVIDYVKAANPPTGVVIIDYIQKVPPTESGLVERYRQVQLVSEEFRKLAAEESIPVIVGAQLNRTLYGNRGKTPRATDRGSLNAIRESSDIGQDASMVLQIGLDKQNGPDNTARMRIEVVKNRNGRADIRFALHVNLSTRRITDDEPTAVDLEPVRPPRYQAMQTTTYRTPSNRKTPPQHRFDVNWDENNTP